jgi:hypothetical protein
MGKYTLPPEISMYLLFGTQYLKNDKRSHNISDVGKKNTIRPSNPSIWTESKLHDILQMKLSRMSSG